MNTISIDFEPFVEWDNSPFVLFSNEGKIIYVNHSAELLFGSVSKKELYDLALAYASTGFGYKTTSISLSYDAFMFHAVTVGYEDEEKISLRLYHTPQVQSIKKLHSETLIPTDINILLEANIALFKTRNTNHLKLLTDQDLPIFKIDQNSFSKLLRKVLHSFRSSDSMDITLRLLIGQHIIINSKKESIAGLTIRANGRYVDSDDEIRSLAAQCHIKAYLKEFSILLEIPLIQ